MPSSSSDATAGFVVADGHRLEIVWHGTRASDAPALVLLHEGLGCIDMWRDWPATLAKETGLAVLVYSRWGYGRSDEVTLPRPLTYMHDEALSSLPELLDAEGVDRAILVGHSDGASMALIHAGSAPKRERVEALILLAPHVFCEDVSVAAIERARHEYEKGTLRERLARYHGPRVDGAFRGWNGAWLDPAFRTWNIEQHARRVQAPTLVIQGREDPYGTLAQLDAIERDVRGPVTRLVLEGVEHAAHRERPVETTAAIVSFLGALGLSRVSGDAVGQLRET